MFVVSDIYVTSFNESLVQSCGFVFTGSGRESISDFCWSSLHVGVAATRWEKPRGASKMTARLEIGTLVAQAAWYDTIRTSFHFENAFLRVCSDV